VAFLRNSFTTIDVADVVCRRNEAGKSMSAGEGEVQTEKQLQRTLAYRVVTAQMREIAPETQLWDIDQSCFRWDSLGHLAIFLE
jgi:hypothetical protein